MRWLELKQAWRPAAVLLAVALTGCGGGDGGGGTGPNNDGGQVVGDYTLAMVDSVTAPVTILFDNCNQTRFRTGSMTLGDDGSWEMTLDFFDAAGNERNMEDYGEFARNGKWLAFRSEAYGDQFKAEISPPTVHMFYDWCGEGHADVDLTFAN